MKNNFRKFIAVVCICNGVAPLQCMTNIVKAAARIGQQ